MSATRILGRYVLREIAAPFLLGMFVLSFVALMPQLVKLAEKVLAFGISVTGVLWLVLYLLPPILLFVIPSAFLLGVLVAFGRLSADSEMIAMRAGGVSLWQLLPPVLTIGVLASVATAALTSFGEPWGRRSLTTFVFEQGRNKAAAALRAQTFNDDFFGLTVYAQAVSAEESRLDGVFLAGENVPSRPFAAQAREGQVVADVASRSIVLRLLDGTLDLVSEPSGPVTRLSFDRMDYNLLPQTTVSKEGHDPYEMDPFELKAHLVAKGKKARGREWMAFHKKFSYPVSALLMGLVGMALGITDPRHGKGRGYTLGLAAMLFYYLLVRIGDATGERGVLAPWIAAWMPNAVFLLGGVWLFLAAARERPTVVERLWARFAS